ncbi:MAG: hypothetical protein WKF85_14635 [Chitinophagaceae bacterium]
MKYRLTLVFILLTTFSFGQTKKAQFYGYSLMEYQRPVPVGDGTWKTYYKNMGESRDRGRVELNETQKTFLIKWEDGDDWMAKFTKKGSDRTYDMMIGNVIKTTYKGKWVDDNSECELAILTTDDNQCVIELKSGRAVDTDKGINAWKKAFRLANMGQCLQSQ